MTYRIGTLPNKKYEIVNVTTQEVVGTFDSKQQAQKAVNVRYEQENPKKKIRPPNCHKDCE